MNHSFSTIIAGIYIVLMFISQIGAEVFLPGMQPKESGIEFWQSSAPVLYSTRFCWWFDPGAGCHLAAVER